MKDRYLVFQRKNGIFFLGDRLLKKQTSLKTRDKATARRICHAKNEALRQPAINLLSKGTASTNIVLRRLHHFALDLDWLPKAILPRR